MATSTNYGWTEPDNTGLVKNGAQDMRTLGDAIDTSLWNVGFGQAGKNKIINGDFGINQRGFTSNTGNSTYNFDRFIQTNNGGTATITPQTFTLGAAPVAGYEGKNFLQYVTSGQSAAGDYAAVSQKIESVRTLANQPATISFWAKATSGTPQTSVSLQQNFGTGGSPSATVITKLAPVTLTTSWVRYSFSTTVPSISGKTIGTAGDSLNVDIWLSAGTSLSSYSAIGIQNTTLQIWGVQIEYGSKATPFQTASGGSPQAELAMCQRYYQALSTTPSGVMVYGGTSSGGFSANAYSNRLFPVQMRTTPTLTFYAHDGSAGQVTLYVATTAIKSTGVASIGASPWGWSGNFSGTGWGTNADSGLLAYGYKAEAEL
jgi:hypothetical protein